MLVTVYGFRLAGSLKFVENVYGEPLAIVICCAYNGRRCPNITTLSLAWSSKVVGLSHGAHPSKNMHVGSN